MPAASFADYPATLGIPQLAHLEWEEYFLLISLITSLRSKDPRSKVGCVIVDDQNHIVGTGYNGFVAGADEESFSWRSEGPWLGSKYPYVVHAELNAIMNATKTDLRDCTVYATLFPCHECLKAILQKGIRKIVYLDELTRHRDSREAAMRLLQAVGASCVHGSLDRVVGFVPHVLFSAQTAG